jgi:hypothetical protein
LSGQDRSKETQRPEGWLGKETERMSIEQLQMIVELVGSTTEEARNLILVYFGYAMMSLILKLGLGALIAVGVFKTIRYGVSCFGYAHRWRDLAFPDRKGNEIYAFDDRKMCALIERAKAM